MANEDIAGVTRPKTAARAAYNRLSGFYDLLAGWSERPARERGLAMLAVQPGERVLEIGFGTGQALVPLARAVGAGGRVDGVDLSEGMLAVAEKRLRAEGLEVRVRLSRGDAADLEFEAGRYDAVFMAFVLELFDTPEIPVVLENCRRSLRPGGRICVVALSKAGGFRPAVRMYGWAHRVFPAYADCRPIYPQRAFIEAGFRIDIVEQMVMWGLGVEVVLARK